MRRFYIVLVYCCYLLYLLFPGIAAVISESRVVDMGMLDERRILAGETWPRHYDYCNTNTISGLEGSILFNMNFGYFC